MIRVLYAEDDPQVAEMVQLYLGRLGSELTLDLVDTGRRCLEAMQRQRYDVLLLDLMMPDLDGLQVLGELTARRDPTPVVMVSGQGQAELAVRALRAGAVDCIDKNSPDFRRISLWLSRAISNALRIMRLSPFCRVDLDARSKARYLLSISFFSASRSITISFITNPLVLRYSCSFYKKLLFITL